MYNNRRLLDVLTRHQIFVEGVKAQFSKEFNDVLRQLDVEFRQLFSRLNFQSLDALTKAALRRFLSDLRISQYKVYSIYQERLISKIKAFMLADIKVSKILFATLYKESLIASGDFAGVEIVSEDEADEILKDQDEENLFPISWFIDKPDNLWSNILNAPIPANGLLMLPFIQGFVGSASVSVQNIVNKGYANRETPQKVLDEITGTKANNWRDGAFNRINAQAGAVIATTLQHTTSITQAGLGSIFFGRYRWVSVIDNVTTDICRSRNGRIYIYGEGPLPPAHINCRSKTIPWVEGGEEFAIPTYYAWIKSQPAAVQNAILGNEKALRLRDGKLKSSDMQKFEDENAISIDDFTSKISTMLTR